MPVSTEQAEGPKKVNVVRLPSAIAVSALPQVTQLPDRNRHCGKAVPGILLHAWQTGTDGGGGGGGLMIVSLGGGVPPPSKLYSLAQPAYNTMIKINMEKNIFTYFKATHFQLLY